MTDREEEKIDLYGVNPKLEASKFGFDFDGVLQDEPKKNNSKIEESDQKDKEAIFFSHFWTKIEGVGSRLGRASSRYGPAPTVFNGPVRKWKKRWVHVSSSSTVSYQNAQSNGKNISSNNGGSHLLLCRWTPIPPSCSAAAPAEHDSVSDGAPDVPPRRKFRYTPIAMLEQQKKVADRKVEDEVKAKEIVIGGQTTAQPETTLDHKMHGNPNMNDTLKKETEVLEKSTGKVSNRSTLDLGLGLIGKDNLDSVGLIHDAEMKRTRSSGFWSMV